VSARPGGEPLITVIVPTRSRPRSLAGCLAALAAQDYAATRFEVIVVDDGGDPPAAAVVDRFRGALDVRLIAQPHRGPARARNRAAREAAGRLLAFTDDDCRPDPAWLRRLESALARHPAAMVGGRVANALAHNRYSSASQLITDIVFAHYNAVPEYARFCTSNNLALTAAAFREIGGFDQRFRLVACEDRDLCDRWTHAGRPLVYVPEAVVNHAHTMGLAEFVRQHFTYGRGAVHFHRLRARRRSGRMRDEMGFHANVRNWLVRPFRRRRPGDALTMAGLLLVWQTVNVAGFLYESVARTGYRA
jgi:GT2 family glycosyltransferase